MSIYNIQKNQWKTYPMDHIDKSSFFANLGNLITINGILYHFYVTSNKDLSVWYLRKYSEWKILDVGIHNFSTHNIIDGVTYTQSNCPSSESCS